jgi:acetyltransferase-like isoleucine patch superfamily enzyme
VVLGVHATVIGATTIESGCIIGAGAVVTKSTKPNGVYAGVPAKRIKERI